MTNTRIGTEACSQDVLLGCQPQSGHDPIPFNIIFVEHTSIAFLPSGLQSHHSSRNTCAPPPHKQTHDHVGVVLASDRKSPRTRHVMDQSSTKIMTIPMKTRGLFVAKVAGGQGRHHVTVPQLLRIQAAVYIARRSHPNAGQAHGHQGRTGSGVSGPFRQTRQRATEHA